MRDLPFDPSLPYHEIGCDVPGQADLVWQRGCTYRWRDEWLKYIQVGDYGEDSAPMGRLYVPIAARAASSEPLRSSTSPPDYSAITRSLSS